MLNLPLKVRIIFLLLCIHFYGKCQNTSTSIVHDIQYGSTLAYKAIKQPIQNPNKSLLVLGAATIGTSIILSHELAIYEATQQSKNQNLDLLSQLAEPFGNPYYQAVGLGGTYLIAKTFKLQTLSDKTTTLISSAALTGVSVVVLKSVFSRARPYQNQGEYSFFNGPFRGDDYQSFPSGHTALAFSLASGLTYLNPEINWIPFVAYPIAGLTAWSRMYDQKHWGSDVFVGAVIGHFIGKIMAQNHLKTQLLLTSNHLGGLSLHASTSF